MNEIKLQAVVIECRDFKDSDKRLALFTCEYGLIWCTIKGVKKPKAKLASISMPFCFAEFLLNKTGDFYTVINASVIENFFDITNNFDKYIIGTSMLEFCKKTVKENDPSVELFILLLKSLRQLEGDKANCMAVLIRFLLDGLSIIGYKLKLDLCAVCGSESFLSYGFNYSLDQGGVVCKKCGNISNSILLEPSEMSTLKNISITSMDNLHNLKFSSRDALVSIINILSKQFKLYTGEEISSIKEYL